MLRRCLSQQKHGEEGARGGGSTVQSPCGQDPGGKAPAPLDNVQGGSGWNEVNARSSPGGVAARVPPDPFSGQGCQGPRGKHRAAFNSHPWGCCCWHFSRPEDPQSSPGPTCGFAISYYVRIQVLLSHHILFLNIFNVNRDDWWRWSQNNVNEFHATALYP